LKQERTTGKASQQVKVEEENPYKAITRWFDSGNHLDLLLDINDATKLTSLYKVDGLHAFVRKHFPQANEKENALLMEFVLYGLSSYSIISKKMLEGRIEFKDLMGSMMNLGAMNYEDDELTEDDFK
jgi:magnesium chelatase subunit I